MCARIKALLRDFEDSLNVGCLALVLRQSIQTTDYCWTKMLKIAVTIIPARVWFATLVQSYRPEQGEAY